MFVLLLLLSVVYGKFVANHTITGITNKDDGGFVFVDKFNFDTSGFNKTVNGKVITVHGRINITAFKVDNPDDVQLALYYDSYWYQVYKSNLTCAERTTGKKVGKVIRASAIEATIKARGSFPVSVRDEVRSHYWYLALVNCKTGVIDNFSYTASFVQAQEGIYHQVSYDRQTLVVLYGFFGLIWGVALLANILGSVYMIKKSFYHPVVRIFTVTVVLYEASLICGFFHHASYNANGVGIPFLQTLGQFLDYSSDIVFMFLLVLLAQGWAISRQTIDHRLVMILGAVVFFLFYIVLMLIMKYAIDPAVVVYEYATLAGIMILILRSAVAVFFGFLVVRSIAGESDADKKSFYQKLLINYGIYFAALPLIAALSSAMPIWYSYKVTMWLYSFVKTEALGVMLILLSPMFAEQYFKISTPSFLIVGDGAKSAASYGGL